MSSMFERITGKSQTSSSSMFERITGKKYIENNSNNSIKNNEIQNNNFTMFHTTDNLNKQISEKNELITFDNKDMGQDLSNAENYHNAIQDRLQLTNITDYRTNRINLLDNTVGGQEILDQKYETYDNANRDLSSYLETQGVSVVDNEPNKLRYNPDYSLERLSTKKSPTDLYTTVEKHKEAMNTDGAKVLRGIITEKGNDYALEKYRQDLAKVEQENVNLWDKTGGNVTRAIDDLFSMFKNTVQYTDGTGKKVNLPSYTDLKQQKVSENYDTQVGKFLGDALYNGTKILGSMGINAMTGGVGGSTVYFSDMYSDSYNNAKLQGYDEGNAMMYALTSVGSEYLTGKLLGSATKGLTGGKTSGYEELLQKGFKKISKNKAVTKFLASASSEATEEFVQEYVDNLNRLLILEQSSNLSEYGSIFTDEEIFQDALYSAGVGAITGGGLNAVNSKVSNNDVLDVFKTELEKEKTNINSKEKIELIDKVITEIDNVKQNQIITFNATQEILPIQNNIQQNIQLPIENSIDIKYNNKEGDTNVERRNIGNISENGTNVGRGLGNIPTNKRISDIFQTNNGRIERNQKRTSIEQDYGTETERREYLEKVKNNSPKSLTSEQIELQNEIKELGVDLKYFVGEDNGTMLGTTDNNVIYLDVNQNNLIDEDSNLRQRFYHELFHNIKRNKNMNFGTEISDLKQYVVENDNEAINKFIESKGYDSSLFSNSKKMKMRFAEEVLSDYSAKYLAGYNVDYNLSQEAEYRLNSLLDDAITTMKLNAKSKLSKENNTINMPPVKTNKVLNPNEISNLEMEEANTTPILPAVNVSTGTGKSKFASNIQNRTNMLTEESKGTILADNDVNYYEEVTNQESLDKAFERLNENGKIEVMNWLSKDSTKADSTDVAEGWILLKQYQDSIANETDLIKKDELNRSMVQVAKKMREIGTKAGQTVQAFNILNRLTPEGMVYYAQSELSEAFDVMSKNKTKKWIDNNKDNFELTPEETQTIMDTMQEVQQMEDSYDKRVKLAEIQKIITDKLPPSRGAGIKSWMRISMLFNPKTQVRNVMGNAVIMPVNTFSDMFASFVDKQIAKKTGVRTTGNTNLKSYTKGFKKGAYESYNDFKKGINTRNLQGNRFEVTEGKSFNDDYMIGKGLNKVDSILSFMLDAGDRTFYEATFTNSINNQLILNNTDTVTQEMVDIATKEALSRTWQDNNNYTKFVLNIRNMLNNLNIKGYGLGDVLIPFAKTPANLTKAIVEYSPAGLVKTINDGVKLKRALSKGEYTVQIQHQFVQDLGKATAGSMLYILAYVLAKAGIITGESDEDKDVANFMKNTLGTNSYSIKIGDKSFAYDWAQPIAAPFSMMANFVQKQEEGASLHETITSTLDTSLNVLFEQSFLESMSNILSEPGEIGTKLTEQFLDLPARAVPPVMKQVADMIDPVQRTSFEYGKPLETAINKVKAKVPFLSQTLSPSVDTMGREIQKYGGKNNIFNVLLNPANVSTENISESAGEIYRLYKSTGETNIMPRVAPYYISKNNEKITLDANQRAEYQKISGEIIENNIKELLNNSTYKNMNDTEKANIINKIVNYSYNKARKEVLDINMSDEYNKVNMYTQDGGTVANYYLNKSEIDYSYNYPEKYNTITQITTYDDYLTYQEEIDNIKNEYDNTNQKKNAVINYVNELNLSIPQKAMLIKLNYSSFNSYNSQIVEYINSQDLSIEEKSEILVKLGFEIKDGRVYW